MKNLLLEMLEKRNSYNMPEKTVCCHWKLEQISWEWRVKGFAPALSFTVVFYSFQIPYQHRDPHPKWCQNHHLPWSYTWNINPCFDPFTPWLDFLQLLFPLSVRKRQRRSSLMPQTGWARLVWDDYIVKKPVWERANAARGWHMGQAGGLCRRTDR